MYCKHCYKMMDDGMAICPSCGKSQTAYPSKNRFQQFLKISRKLLLGIAVWFAAVLVIAIVGSAMNLSASGGIISSMYSLIIAIIPVLLAFKVALPKKVTSNTPTHQTASSADKPISKANELKNKDDKVDEIVQSLREGTFQDTVQNLFGDSNVSYTDVAEDNDPLPKAPEGAEPKNIKRIDTNLNNRNNNYVINPQTMVFHRRSCAYAKKTYAFNKHYTDSRSAAISVGYKPCKYCKP